MVMSMHGNSDFPGHSNRVFCVRFNPFNSNLLASGGWDNTISVYDIRRKGPVAAIYGPHVCGDTIDFHKDGNTFLTGSYRQDNVLELFDIRNFKRKRIIDWDGPKASEGPYKDMYTKPLNLEDGVEQEPPKEIEEKPVDDEIKMIGDFPTEVEGYSR